MTAYIQLIVPEQLDKHTFTAWFECVKNHVPSGLLGNTQIEHRGEPKQTNFYQKPTVSGKHAYVIPLVRNLDASEVHGILKAWCLVYPEGDFLLDYSQDVQKPPAESDLLTQHTWELMCDAWCKQQHVTWMQDKQAAGWRYGATVSVTNKTHPWMQPWETLPEAGKQQNVQAFQSLLQVLSDFGYEVRQKPEG